MVKSIVQFCNCDLKMKNGHGQMVRAHYKMLNELYPNKITTIMIPDVYETDYDGQFYYLPKPTQKEKIIPIIKGYTPELSIKSINKFLSIIKMKNPDVVFIESSMFGKLIENIKRINSNIKVISYFTDIEADLLKQEMVNSSLKRKLICKILKKNEKLTVKYADGKFVLNKRDEKLYKKYYNEYPDEIIPLIIEKNDILNSGNKHFIGDNVIILFVGGDFWPNVVGIRWFIENVVPQIHVPFRLKIVGLNMEKYRNEFESKSASIQVVGTVDDLKPFFGQADVFVAPVHDGGGMKYKTAEALSYGKTFLGLEESLVGYWEHVPDALKNNGIYLCENEFDYADQINNLYKQEFEKCRFDIKIFIEELCSYDQNIKIMKRLIEKQ